MSDPLPQPFQAAAGLIAQNRHREALDLLGRHAEAAPHDAAAWNAIGVCQRALRQYDYAIAAYRRALTIDPLRASTWSNCGNALVDAQRPVEAVAALRRARQLDPGEASFARNLGLALQACGETHAALAEFEAGIALGGQGEVEFNRAQALLTLGDFARGWAAYADRWKVGEVKRPGPLPGLPWGGESAPQATLLLHSEQGFGDTILALRYLPHVAVAFRNVILRCQPALLPLIASTLPANVSVQADSQPMPEADFHALLLDLPGLLTPDLASIPPAPYLLAPEDRIARLAPLFAGETRLKVGIVWSGSVTFRGNAQRAAKLDDFVRHFHLPQVRLYSLQKGPPERELADLPPHVDVTDLSPHLGDFADTAAAIHHLDLVLMTDSGVAHLAGALGRPVWVLLSQPAYWLWLQDRSDSPWYPSMRLFRQPQAGAWEAAFSEAREALGALLP